METNNEIDSLYKLLWDVIDSAECTNANVYWVLGLIQRELMDGCYKDDSEDSDG